MASVRKRTLPSGKTAWQVDYTDAAGKRRSKQFRTKREADAHETKVRAEVSQGIHVADSASVTVAHAAELWIKAGQTDGLEASTTKQREEHARLHIIPLIGGMKLTQLTAPTIENLKDALMKDRSRAMTRAVLTSVRGMLALARRRGLVGQNPAEGVKVDKRRAEDDDDAPIPPKDLIRAILLKSTEIWPLVRVTQGRWVAGQGRPKHTIAIPWRPLLVTAIFTGMRASELRGLRWPHIDLAAGVIRVRERADRYQKLGPPKSRAGRRDIPLAPMVTSVLREWRDVCPPTEQNLAFPTDEGRIILHTNLLRQGYYPVLKACGVMAENAKEPPYPFHSIRHAAASLFIEQGWTPKRIQTVMGHSSITVTYDVYGHLFPNPDDDQRAMEQLQASLLGEGV